MSTKTPPLVRLRWGEALTTVRRRSGCKLRPATEAINEFWPASVMTLNRLEDLDEAPTDPRTRTLAVLALLAYGWEDLSAFGLSLNDLPRGLDRERLRDLELAISRCTLASAV